MNKNIELKKRDVDKFIINLEKNSSIILIDYKGLSANEIFELRKKLYNINNMLNIFIIRNLICSRAFKKIGLILDKKILINQTAVIFINNIDFVIESLKIIRKIFKKKINKFGIKVVIINKKIYSIKEEIKNLSKIPNKKELLFKLIIMLKYSINKLNYVINEVKKKKK